MDLVQQLGLHLAVVGDVEAAVSRPQQAVAAQQPVDGCCLLQLRAVPGVRCSRLLQLFTKGEGIDSGLPERPLFSHRPLHLGEGDLDPVRLLRCLLLRHHEHVRRLASLDVDQLQPGLV